jgi:hypothetical protein
MMIRLGSAYLCLHMCVFLTMPLSVYAAADQVVEYLTILQSLTVTKPPVSTPEQRKQFCKEWEWILARGNAKPFLARIFHKQ